MLLPSAVRGSVSVDESDEMRQWGISETPAPMPESSTFDVLELENVSSTVSKTSSKPWHLALGTAASSLAPPIREGTLLRNRGQLFGQA